MLVPWLVAASARTFDHDSQLIPGSLAGSQLNGYFSDYLKSRRARVRTLLFVLLFLWDGFMGLYLLFLVFSFIFLAFFKFVKVLSFFLIKILKSLF